jgi:hypothetical protein
MNKRPESHITRSIFAAAVVFFAAAAGISQTASPPPPSVDEIVRNAATQRLAYVAEFKNLLSRETKTFQTIAKDGRVKDEKSVVSTFLVYQLPGNGGKITEFRSVQSVDGKPVEGAETRTNEFFQTVAKAGTNEQQLAAIQKESTRYDGSFLINGLTLYQAIELDDNLRPVFKFTLKGREDFGGHPVYVIDYEQTSGTPYIYTNSKRGPTDGKLSYFFNSGYGDRDVDAGLNGTLYIDAATYQVRRAIRRATVSPKRDGNRVTVSETDFQYSDSEFGILPPKKIILTLFRAKSSSAQKDAVVTFDYDKFRRPETDVKMVEETN